MGNSNKYKANVGGKLGAAVGVAAALAPIVKDVIVAVPVKPAAASEDCVVMPDLCSKKVPLKLTEAVTLLEGRGLKALPIEVRVNEAGTKYKDCFESQVISSEPKAGTKLKIGETVVVQYVTAELIDESQKIFLEMKRQKEELKEERAVKRAEQMERAKTAVGGAVSKAKAGVKKMAHHKGVKQKKEEETSYEQK